MDDFDVFSNLPSNNITVSPANENTNSNFDLFDFPADENLPNPQAHEKIPTKTAVSDQSWDLANDLGSEQETKTLTTPEDGSSNIQSHDKNIFNNNGPEDNTEVRLNAAYTSDVNDESNMFSFNEKSDLTEAKVEKANNDNLFGSDDKQQLNILESTNIASDDFPSDSQKSTNTAVNNESIQQQQFAPVVNQEFAVSADKQSVFDQYDSEIITTHDQQHFVTETSPPAISSLSQQEEYPITLSDSKYEQFDDNENETSLFAPPTISFDQKRQLEIAEKDAEEQRKTNELKQQAKQDLNQWYNERQKRLEEKRKQMKNDEEILRTKAQEKSVKQTCNWDKVLQYIDFSPTSGLTKSKRDLSRMKTILLNVKQTPKMSNGI
ncbi:unnamed protein product [Didymodactylos carnosus]|uniref:Clathrin light chain n=1 Tax=Didymodactylos carnosus TaxID=1234261 RepID=A0A814BEJ5_9BILA|nr:unnamed protein product [Didymodactylos carnosus]CAF3706776.1 unnamed protein product [Didymodactylos carnosus]